MNNITFDGNSAGLYGYPTFRGYVHFFLPFYGEENTATFFNCTFRSGYRYALIGPCWFNSNYINCLFTNFQENLFKEWHRGDFDEAYTSFKNCIFIDNDLDVLLSPDDYEDINDLMSFDGIWFGENSVPDYVSDSEYAEVDELVTKYAMFTAYENYIGNNQYEIIGKLTWNGTDEIADGFNPMTVTLSSTTGDIQSTAILVNGIFKAIYTSNSPNNAINVVLNSVEIPVNFNNIGLTINAPSIIYGGIQNITVTLSQAITGKVNLTVNNNLYELTFNNVNSTEFTIPDALPAGTHEITAIFADAQNHIYGSNSTDIIVSKVSDYDFNATVTPTVYLGDNATVTLSLPSGATGNVTVKVGDNEAKTFNVNDIISINGFVAGKNVINITYNGNDVYDAKSVVKNISALNKPVITIPEIDAGKATTTTITLPQNATGNVTVIVDGKVTDVVNLTNGSATVTIPELPAGKHNVTISYSGDDNYAGFAQTSSVEVKEPAKPTPKPDDQKPATVKKTATKITAKKKTFKAKTKVKKYTITLKAGKKAVKKVQVTLKIGKKTYKAKTNSKGKATFKIKKLTKKGKYSAKITFKGNKLYKATTKKVKITVKK